jgi:hypothetical protein
MIAFLFVLIIMGAVLYLVEQYVPMAPPFRIVIRVVVILMLAFYLLRLIGWAPGLIPPRVG